MQLIHVTDAAHQEVIMIITKGVNTEVVDVVEIEVEIEENFKRGLIKININNP
jgi:hypothetical protein